ncbi:phosphohistidine phosphatase [Roseivivax lentus]|uniref:Phosphohistidine phosphatase n=1 Tax=Roseivivax lentus TaxID=633194 RepID=A0A1N7M9L9_9RHOB|nr:histidine phosphatase family protein [Roseivivax lentus]SIS82780.1 phosphohistidine phosphatase [Roseivivax lentus]
MRRLILMRHAKSDWQPGVEDHDRPLNGRGRKSATALGRWLRQTGHLPDAAVVSSAMRTIETFGRLDLDCDVRRTRGLYLADVEQMLTELRQETAETVLMLGHNPGIAYMADLCVAEAPDHPRFRDYPTGATLVAEFDIDDWSELETGTGRVADFVVPRELLDP